MIYLNSGLYKQWNKNKRFFIYVKIKKITFFLTDHNFWIYIMNIMNISEFEYTL